jgi:hypothetical protein
MKPSPMLARVRVQGHEALADVGVREEVAPVIEDDLVVVDVGVVEGHPKRLGGLQGARRKSVYRQAGDHEGRVHRRRQVIPGAGDGPEVADVELAHREGAAPADYVDGEVDVGQAGELVVALDDHHPAARPLIVGRLELGQFEGGGVEESGLAEEAAVGDLDFGRGLDDQKERGVRLAARPHPVGGALGHDH